MLRQSPASSACPYSEAFAHQAGSQSQLPLAWTTAGPTRPWSRGCFPERREAGVQLPSHSLPASPRNMSTATASCGGRGIPASPRTPPVHHDNAQRCTGDRVQPLFRCSLRPRPQAPLATEGLYGPLADCRDVPAGPLCTSALPSHTWSNGNRGPSPATRECAPLAHARHARSFNSCTGLPWTEAAAVRAALVPQSIIRRPRDVRHYKCPTYD